MEIARKAKHLSEPAWGQHSLMSLAFFADSLINALWLYLIKRAFGGAIQIDLQYS